ncbi:cytochrome c oxidase subunit I, partial [Paraburkholderia sp. SIMBA_050]
CDDACAQKLYFMRQIRVTQAGERHRLTMVWLRSDAGAIPPKVLEAYPDTRRLVADPAAVAAWLPADAGTTDSDHLYLVDPNGNLMMRFPKNPNPSKIKTDVTKLLKWSSIG